METACAKNDLPTNSQSSDHLPHAIIIVAPLFARAYNTEVHILHIYWREKKRGERIERGGRGRRNGKIAEKLTIQMR